MATSISIIVAVIMFILEKKGADKKQRIERENLEIARILERTRDSLNSFREVKDIIFEITIKICRLLYKCKSETEFDELKNNINDVEGEIALRTKFLIDDIKAECDVNIASIRGFKKEKVKSIITECLKRLEASIDIGACLMSVLKNAVFGMIDNGNHQQIKPAVMHYLGIFNQAGQLWEIKEIKKLMWRAEAAKKKEFEDKKMQMEKLVEVLKIKMEKAEETEKMQMEKSVAEITKPIDEVGEAIREAEKFMMNLKVGEEVDINNPKINCDFKKETKEYILGLDKDSKMEFGFLSSVNRFFTEISSRLAELD